ncbi:6-phosphogluconolactonase [Candidatus Gullanella endobia]|uniref:6-phosphogluconolactonase n=1 Tax=Candidatus Gullanella endobia TaxID=1070130 RepID=A0A143WRW8_9ENTR|nr:6-phosphogluconolactonase [Candidatus Gullanella endobia]CUX96267.1 6-phosphogluconolactonase [Candidatus Gullanella endobia]
MKQIIYIASSESQQIHVWKIDNQGVLTLLQIVDTPGQGNPMVINLRKMYLYIGIRPSFSVISYKINQQGLLIKAGISSLPGSPTQLSINSKSETLYSVSYNGACLAVSPIDKKGIIGEPIQILENLTYCHSANIDTTNQVLWVPCLKENRIRFYNISESGYLTLRKPEALDVDGAGPRHMVFHYSGNYAYVINEFSGTVNVIAIDSAGFGKFILETLDMVPTSFSNIRWAADIHITPDNRLLYCCDRIASIISWFAVSENGRVLRFLGYQETETQPRSFNIDFYGKFLIVAGQKSHHITVYVINARSGALKPIGRYKVGRGPVWVSILAC